MAKKITKKVPKNKSCLGPEQLGVSDHAPGVEEVLVGLEHHHRTGEVEAVPALEVLQVAVAAKVAVDQPAGADGVGRIQCLYNKR